ncbi:MAG: acyltransferase [Merismopedia sp. SIO2A8]|nr:acyltransferase [Merismopedia sp. SIO2A8]
MIYPFAFAQFGAKTVIQPNVEFEGTDQITMGSEIRVRQGVVIRRIGGNSHIRIDNHVSLDSGVNIRTYHDSTVEIGSHTVIGPYTCLSGGNLRIGQDCMIASHVSIYANNHNFADPHRKIREQSSSRKGIAIENDCWLGTGVRVVDGVTIGQGSVIGAGAVVTKSIPPYSIAVGVPAKVVGKRGQQYTEPLVSNHLTG